MNYIAYQHSVVRFDIARSGLDSNGRVLLTAALIVGNIEGTPVGGSKRAIRVIIKGAARCKSRRQRKKGQEGGVSNSHVGNILRAGSFRRLDELIL